MCWTVYCVTLWLALRVCVCILPPPPLPSPRIKMQLGRGGGVEGDGKRELTSVSWNGSMDERGQRVYGGGSEGGVITKFAVIMTWAKLDRLWTSSCQSLVWWARHTKHMPHTTRHTPHTPRTRHHSASCAIVFHCGCLAVWQLCGCYSGCGCVVVWLRDCHCVIAWLRGIWICSSIYLFAGCLCDTVFAFFEIARSREWFFWYLDSGRNGQCDCKIVGCDFILLLIFCCTNVRLCRTAWFMRFQNLLWIVEFYACRRIDKFCFVSWMFGETYWVECDCVIGWMRAVY